MAASARPGGLPGGASGECANCITLQRVKLLLEQSEAAQRVLRDELRKARGELATRDRQLEVSKRMLARVNADKSAAEVAAESEKQTARKLEQRLVTLETGEGPAAKASKYRGQVLQLKEHITQLETALMAAEEARHHASREVHVLKSALGLKNEVSDGVLESHGKMLHALAQSQEESSALALALGEKEAALAEGTAALRGAKAEVDRLLNARLALVSELEDARHEVDDALKLAAECRQDALAARQEAASLADQLQQLEAEQGRLQSALRAAEAGLDAQRAQSHSLSAQLADARSSARLTVETLRAEVAQAVQQAEARAADERADMSARALALGQQVADLRQQLQNAAAVHEQELQAVREEAAAGAAVTARRARQEVDEAQAKHQRALALAEDSANELRTRVAALERANANLQEEVEAAERAARAADQDAEAAAAAAATERRSVAGLRAALESLEHRMTGSIASSSQRENELTSMVAYLRQQLDNSEAVASQLQEEVKVARAQAATVAGHQAVADSQLEQLHATIESLSASKTKLQTGMLDQLSAFKVKLAEAEEENRQLRELLQERMHPPPRARSPTETRASPAAQNPSAGRAQELLAAARAARASGAWTIKPSSIMSRARAHSRALGYENSEDDSDTALSPRQHPPGSKLTPAALTHVRTALRQPRA